MGEYFRLIPHPHPLARLEIVNKGIRQGGGREA